MNTKIKDKKLISACLVRSTLAIFFVVAINLCLGSQVSATETAKNNKVIYLVRHAEKIKSDNKNPHLTDKGKLRAINLANMLSDKDIKAIYSTKYARTMETASPSAKLMDLPIQSYDPSQLERFASSLLSKIGNMLIVGHSNTTPNLVNLLGGEAGDGITESEYDRVYKLEFTDGKVLTELLHSSAEQLR